MKIRRLTILVLISFVQFSYAQEIKVSDKLMLIKLSKTTYIHTSDNNNGIVYVNRGKAIIVSTPATKTETQELIDWVQNSLQSKIIGYVIDRWHPDAMGGLDVVKQNGITSYSFELTRTIAKNKNLPVPEIGFDPKIELKVGNEIIICHFLGAAHTDDGIVVWIPSEKVLFGGNGIRNFNGWVGNIGDANIDEWPKTIEKVKAEYGSAEIVIPGHGTYGGAELIDYTIELYKPNKWGQILRKHDIKRSFVFNEYENYFEVAQSYSINEETRYLIDATLFAIDETRYMKIESPLIKHNIESKRIDSEYGRLQIYKNDSEAPATDLYYNGLVIFKLDDEVGYRIIIQRMIR